MISVITLRRPVSQNNFVCATKCAGAMYDTSHACAKSLGIIMFGKRQIFFPSCHYYVQNKGFLSSRKMHDIVQLINVHPKTHEQEKGLIGCTAESLISFVIFMQVLSCAIINNFTLYIVHILSLLSRQTRGLVQAFYGSLGKLIS